jgi:hypothetical protein
MPPAAASRGFVEMSEVRWREAVVLDTIASRCRVDGIEHVAQLGNWMFYLPETGEKFFHAAHGVTDCTHATRPTDAQLQEDWANETYTSADWRRALSTPLARRLAELWVAGARLARAGLGPLPIGLTLASRFIRDGAALGYTMGLRWEHASCLPPKPPATDSDLIAAGVRPDRIRSCVRQQLNGYVIDLSSVVGVQPIDAEEEVAAVRQWIDRTWDEGRRRQPAC